MICRWLILSEWIRKLNKPENNLQLQVFFLQPLGSGCCCDVLPWQLTGSRMFCAYHRRSSTVKMIHSGSAFFRLVSFPCHTRNVLRVRTPKACALRALWCAHLCSRPKEKEKRAALSSLSNFQIFHIYRLTQSKERTRWSHTEMTLNMELF